MLHVASHWKATIHIYHHKKFPKKSKNRMNSQQPAQNH
jgi:hypothetical protein